MQRVRARALVRRRRFDQVPAVAERIGKDGDGAVGFMARGLGKGHTCCAHSGVVAVEIVGMQKQPDTPTALLSDIRAGRPRRAPTGTGSVLRAGRPGPSVCRRPCWCPRSPRIPVDRQKTPTRPHKSAQGSQSGQGASCHFQRAGTGLPTSRARNFAASGSSREGRRARVVKYP